MFEDLGTISQNEYNGATRLLYQIGDTLNSSLNIDKLNYELIACDVDTYKSVRVEADGVAIYFSEVLTQPETDVITQIVNDHDGAVSKSGDKSLTLKRKELISRLTSLAINHKNLAQADVVSYLTSIDSYLNAYIISGDSSLAVQKISQDAQNINSPHFAYLHTVVNSAGNKCYEYLIYNLMQL